MAQSFRKHRSNFGSYASRSVSRASYWALALIVVLNLAGCDPVRRTIQAITIKVEDDRGRPLSGVKLRMKESWESWRSWPPAAGEDPELRRRWESDAVPWIEGATDTEGAAILKYDVTRLDGIKGNTPPPDLDWVSNREYVVKLQRQEAEEELFVKMSPGTTSKGKRFTVRIEAIEMPVYHPVKN